jgi:SiaC family regulatory phosphoprotein
MEKIRIEATDRSPEIDFDFEAGAFVIRGESYPEDVASFYGPVIDKLDDYLNLLTGGTVRFDFELIYFNSSSAKVLMGLFDALEATAANGVSVLINWIYDADDDTMEELGEEFAEDLSYAKFSMQKRSG